jgi:hypothetical protein
MDALKKYDIVCSSGVGSVNFVRSHLVASRIVAQQLSTAE